MDINTVIRKGTFAALVVSVAACGPSDEARRKADSAVAAAARSEATAQAGEVISTRREAQAYFDSARAGFLTKKTAIASKELKDAAVFTRAQADSATGVAKKALNNSAGELTRLSTQVTKNRVRSVKALDYAFARTQIAEAQFHHERAVAAARGAKPAVAGAELIMVTDHLERAFADAGRTANEPAKMAIADARAVASKLTSGASVMAADVDSVLMALDKQVRTFAATAAKLKA